MPPGTAGISGMEPKPDRDEPPSDCVSIAPVKGTFRFSPGLDINWEGSEISPTDNPCGSPITLGCSTLTLTEESLFRTSSKDTDAGAAVSVGAVVGSVGGGFVAEGVTAAAG